MCAHHKWFAFSYLLCTYLLLSWFWKISKCHAADNSKIKYIMRYLRPLMLHPESLKSKAQKTWINYVIRELQNYQITECRLKKDLSINNFSDLQASYKKNTIQITSLLDKNLPKVLQEELFDVGLYLIRYCFFLLSFLLC